MKIKKYSTVPVDAKDRIKAKPIVCYPIEDLKENNLSILHSVRKNLKSIDEIIIPPRDARTFVSNARTCKSSNCVVLGKGRQK